jgi:hypothetical protein
MGENRMETYEICGEHILFAKTNVYLQKDTVSITLQKKTVLECADEIARTVPKENPYTFSNMRLCLSCNSYGFSSTYTKITPEGDKLDLCTSCANRMRTDGFHIVDQETMTIQLRRTVKEHKYSSNEIHQRVIQAEKETEEKGKRRRWYLRACKAGVCPKCGKRVKNIDFYPNSYECKSCSFKIVDEK